MFRSLRLYVLPILLAILCLGALPTGWRAETASARLRPVEIQDARTNARTPPGTPLGEDAAEPQNPPDYPRAAAEGGAATGTMTLSVPKLGLRNVPVPTASSQAALDREGIIHLKDTGVPWEEGTNTFIVGHALGFSQTRVPYVFRHLDRMEPGDEIFVEDGSGERYTFRVYDRMTVRPADYWVTYPVPGATVISLQTCTPFPTFERRLVVRGDLVGS